MPYAFYKVRANAEELNRFLRSYRVLAVRNEWVAAGEDSFWTFCVDYVERPSSKDSAKSGSNRVDYKDVLPPEQPRRRLRAVRTRTNTDRSVRAT